MKRKLRVLGVCAGNGVCLYPFKNRRNFKIIGNIEPRGVFYDKKETQWGYNFPGIPQYRHWRGHKFSPDVIIGHPDCGDSSILRLSRSKRRGDAGNNESIKLFLDSITKYQPRFWLMENLPGFLNVFGVNDLQELFPEYHLKALVESVSWWGNSQVTRKRLVLLGFHRTVEIQGYSMNQIWEIFDSPTRRSEPLHHSEFFELGEKEIPNICHVREPLQKKCNLYLPEQGLRQISYSDAHEQWENERCGESRWKVGGNMKNQPGVTRNLKGAYPATVRKQNRQFGTQGFVLSPREMANIQGVPLDFKLYFDEKERVYWLNKGRLTVTKTMPYEIALWFRKCLSKAIKRD